MDGMLSQEEINALLNSMNTPSASPSPVSVPDGGLTDAEKDAIGEISNISMGTAATTLSQLINQKVNITTLRFLMPHGTACLRNLRNPVYAYRFYIPRDLKAIIY